MELPCVSLYYNYFFFTPQREIAVTAFCVPTAHACLPAPTVMAWWSAQGAQMSSTAVSIQVRSGAHAAFVLMLGVNLKRNVCVLADPLCTRYMEFVCRNRAQCLFQSLVCDGTKHCSDGSDEDAAYAGCCESTYCV